MRNKPTKIRSFHPAIVMPATILHRGGKGEINFQNEPKKCIFLICNRLHRLFFASFLLIPIIENKKRGVI
jgi:hypothetical protein